MSNYLVAFNEHKDIVQDMSYNVFGNRLATCSCDQTVKVKTFIFHWLFSRLSKHCRFSTGVLMASGLVHTLGRCRNAPHSAALRTSIGTNVCVSLVWIDEVRGVVNTQPREQENAMSKLGRRSAWVTMSRIFRLMLTASTLSVFVHDSQNPIIPERLQTNILEVLHHAYPAMVRMKALARSYVWWPQIDEDIEYRVADCVDCQLYRNNPPKAPPRIWNWTPRPWSRLHMDFAGSFCGKTYLLVIDSHSKWLDVQQVASMESKEVIHHLARLFATHGLPDVVVTDNAASLDSTKFREFCAANRITFLKVAPYHPSSNGLVERVLQTTKQALRAMTPDKWRITLSRFLFNYRLTPHSATAPSPAEIPLRRRLKSLLYNLHPDSLEASVRIQQENAVNLYLEGTQNPRTFQEGDRVWARDFHPFNSTKWVAGVIQAVHCGPVWKIDWAHPCYGQVLASCSFDRTVVIWEETVKKVNAGQNTEEKSWVKRASLVDSRCDVVDAKFSPSCFGLLLAAGARDGTVRIYEAVDLSNLAQWNLQHEIQASCHSLTCLAWCASENHRPMLAVGTDSVDPENPKLVLYTYKEDFNQVWDRVNCTVDPTHSVNDLKFAPSLGRTFHLLAVAGRTLQILSVHNAFTDRFDENSERESLSDIRVKLISEFSAGSVQFWRLSWNITGTMLSAIASDGVVYIYHYTSYDGKWQLATTVLPEGSLT
ncbi:hypothetical protein M514_05227 [Trichuris suis]|uniref:RNA-directed DNA polymerase n=1 Tax=Trichuris suis TaxID=68888 RepID=A0A085ND02_9BILA|nr:hypothetical protein M514_05227 [Trichuris suis]